MGYKAYENGKDWEQEIIDYYSNKNYFTYKIPTVIKGTVFDIIAIRKGCVLCIEAKHITGDKLYFKSSGLEKKADEIDHFVNTSHTNLYLFIKSDKLNGIYWTTWIRSSEKLKRNGKLDLQKDCHRANMGD